MPTLEDPTLDDSTVCSNTTNGLSTDENQIEGPYTETGVNCITADCTDTDDDGIPDSCQDDVCTGDFDGNEVVEGVDLAYFLGHWGDCALYEDCPWDLNGDLIVDGEDLAIILTAWGPCPE